MTDEAFDNAMKSYTKFRKWSVEENGGDAATTAQDWVEWCGFCGCGNPEVLHALMRDGMRYLTDYWTRVRASDWRKNEPDSGYALGDFREITQEEARYLLMYVLDQMRLTEHGSSVRGQWPTSEGEAFLADLTREIEA